MKIPTVKTKSITEPVEESDGYRVCVMRWVKPWYKYDELLATAAPNVKLLSAYKSRKMDWAEYESVYLAQMATVKGIAAVDTLAAYAHLHSTITLLCWEKDDAKCHRRLLAELVRKRLDEVSK